ncbi:recombination regulator RecX [Streptomyces neyagawaensis]|uniref:recombination regulator RecX n=1 Tax=Streptomyces neyagawaensis TaxID=42238 RepID=UPI00099F2951|nr:recombination regulator RecX [Streptomyces neyagawaensis]MCL6731448.1 recombination regulator RecX [Streptomyces neyagawaensis]MDE1683428.1 recombination regulator RecX [Streptomyces neyagawaensis]
MTRRTDWGEYAYPSAPESRGRGGTGGSAAEEFGPYAGDADEEHVAGPPGEGDPSGGGAPRGGRGRGGGGRGGAVSPGAAGETRGRRGRGGRRRGFGESAGDSYDDGGSQDGGSSFSSRAEKGESSGDPAERARAICLRLLTGTPRTRKQLADALRKREIPGDVADEVLSRFEEVGLINDSAFADAWVESRHHGRGLARRALARELRTKGVDSALIDEAVAQLDSDQEEATARELVARKLRSTRGLDRDKRLRRLAGMLARKGYPEGMALRVVRQALEEEGEDTEGLEEGY